MAKMEFMLPVPDTVGKLGVCVPANVIFNLLTITENLLSLSKSTQKLNFYR